MAVMPFLPCCRQGGLSDALRWERIDAAADAQQPAVMRSAARGLPAADLALANNYAAFVDKPNASALNWPRNERSRRIATDGLAKLAKGRPRRHRAAARSTPGRSA